MMQYNKIKINKYKKILNKIYPKEICDLWNDAQLILNKINFKGKKDSDGRLNSATLEKTVIDELIKLDNNIKKAKNREWFDFAYHDYYINLKITTGKTDNAMNKKALLYSFTTNKINKIPNNMNFNKLSALSKMNVKTIRDDKTYYYLVLFKDKRIPIIKSMIDIQNYVSNPCNFLQINWNKEYKYNLYDYDNDKPICYSMKRIFSIIQNSLRKSYDSFDDFLEEKFYGSDDLLKILKKYIATKISMDYTTYKYELLIKK